VDRSALLSSASLPQDSQTVSGTRVVLLTLDRNCEYFKCIDGLALTFKYTNESPVEAVTRFWRKGLGILAMTT